MHILFMHTTRALHAHTHGINGLSLQLAFTMHLVEGSDDPMQILKDLTAQRQRVLGRQGLFGYEARFKSKECQTGMMLRTNFDVFRDGNVFVLRCLSWSAYGSSLSKILLQLVCI